MEAFNARMADFEQRQKAFDADNTAFIERIRSGADGSPASRPRPASPAPTDDAVLPEALSAMREDLRKTESGLRAAFEALVAEKQAIEAERASVRTDKQAAAFNERILAFRERMDAFRDQQQAFEADIAVYNDRVLDAPGEPPETPAPPVQ